MMCRSHRSLAVAVVTGVVLVMAVLVATTRDDESSSCERLEQSKHEIQARYSDGDQSQSFDKVVVLQDDVITLQRIEAQMLNEGC